MKPTKPLLLIPAITIALTGANAQTIDNITDFTPYKTYNYIFSKTVLIPQTGTSTNYREVFQYYDGLGRLMQTVDYKASPKKNDVIQPVEYDAFGREAIKYLPYADTINSATKKGAYRDSWKTEQSGFFTVRYGTPDGPNAYAVTKFEDSPLNRVMKQGAPGNVWQPNTSTTTRQSGEHVISYQYASNTTADSVYYWTISGTYPGTMKFTRKSYAANTLYKNIITDENGNPTTEFKDLQGKVVMKRDALNGKTFYIYDDFELLRCVIPPLASQTLAARTKLEFTASESDFQELCYYYEYDQRQRMIKKKLPGTVGVYEMKYNSRDLLTETKDPNGNRLQYYYDDFSRPNLTALIKPDGTEEIISTTTYDDYYSIDSKYPYVDRYGYPKETNVKGKTTITTAKVIEPSGIPKTELNTVYYYDKYGRLIQTVADNHLGGIDRISYRYKYKNSELIAEKKHEHCKSGTAITDSITECNYYDHAGRLLYTTLKINKDVMQKPAVMTYNEIGQMVQKNLGSLTSQPVKLNYKYNIRGWLTYINDPTNLTNGQLFNLWLNYTTGNSPNRYNGNITDMVWKGADKKAKRYCFEYDALNRLKSSVYDACDSVYPIDIGRYNENYTYDANGNILTVKRWGLLMDGTSNQGLIDDLTYKYFNSGKSNRLYAVADAAVDVMSRGDFIDGSKGSSSQEYYYDNNGNMTKDNNGGNLFKYNFLNLPYYYSSMYDLRISYDATGRKLRYDNTDYAGPFVYESGVLRYIITGEGRAIPDGSSYQYEYHIKDHLGNVRVAFINNNGTPQVVQTNNYYPFGMLMAERTNTGTNKNPYLYNGKERFTGEYYNWYDYGARMYDPQLGRWHSVDPLAHNYMSYSPYSYALNNPIFFIDPDGRRVDVSGIYVKDNDGNYKYPELIKAFENFAKTKEGQKFLADYAEAGQEIAGVKYEKSGQYHDKKIDLNFGAKVLTNKDGSISTANGWTETSTKNGRYQISFFNNTAANNNDRADYMSVMNNPNATPSDKLAAKNKYIYNATGTITHETLIHGVYDTGDILDNGAFDLSNVPMTISGHPHHYKANRDAYKGQGRFTTDGYSIMRQMNQKYRQFKSDVDVWNDMWDFEY